MCDPEERACRNEFAGRAAAALLTLSDDERETIVQHRYAGLTFREIDYAFAEDGTLVWRETD